MTKVTYPAQRVVWQETGLLCRLFAAYAHMCAILTLTSWRLQRVRGERRGCELERWTGGEEDRRGGEKPRGEERKWTEGIEDMGERGLKKV